MSKNPFQEGRSAARAEQRAAVSDEIKRAQGQRRRHQVADETYRMMLSKFGGSGYYCFQIGNEVLVSRDVPYSTDSGGIDRSFCDLQITKRDNDHYDVQIGSSSRYFKFMRENIVHLNLDEPNFQHLLGHYYEITLNLKVRRLTDADRHNIKNYNNKKWNDKKIRSNIG